MREEGRVESVELASCVGLAKTPTKILFETKPFHSFLLYNLDPLLIPFWIIADGRSLLTYQTCKAAIRRLAGASAISQIAASIPLWPRLRHSTALSRKRLTQEARTASSCFGPVMSSLLSKAGIRGLFNDIARNVVRQPLAVQAVRLLLVLCVYYIELGSFWPYVRSCRGQLSPEAASAPIQVSSEEMRGTYGSRGVAHCEEWLTSLFASIFPAAFDIDRPTDHHNIPTSIIPWSDIRAVIPTLQVVHGSLPSKSLAGSAQPGRTRSQGMDCDRMARGFDGYREAVWLNGEVSRSLGDIEAICELSN